MADRSEAGASRIRIELTGVPETLLWTLYYRAGEARRPDAVLHDPRAVELVDRIDYPFTERFGRPRANGFTSQLQALRVRCFDEQVRRFLAEHPDGTVVALGEGLETQFWRVDNGRMRWLTVDLPETVAVRERLLPPGPRQRIVTRSVLDHSWLDEVDAPPDQVLVTAEGLFMYLPPAEVRDLIAACAQRLPGGALLFDAVPRWFAGLATRGKLKLGARFPAPPMPWGMDPDELPKIRAVHDNITEVRGLWPTAGRGLFFRYLAPLAPRIPVLRNLRPSIGLVTFGPGS